MTIDEVVSTLLKNRGLTTKKQVGRFFNPPHPDKLSLPFDPRPGIKLIQKHIQAQNKIAVYGDYDVDGICSTAILWETLYSNYKNVFPHIPHREAEGYGLTTKGINHCLDQGAKLIIAVDNGIVAWNQIDYCRKKKCDIIVIDHHQPSSRLPTPDVLLHSTSACAASLTWLFCRELHRVSPCANSAEHLALAAIATICDLVPLLGVNRSFAKYGLVELNRTSRPGLLALLEEARIRPDTVGAYEVGFTIGPRLNAMGRLEHAIDSLRLLCTHDPVRAASLAKTLGEANRSRQQLTQTSVNHALQQITANDVILAADTSYHQGVIGLIAAKLVENFWRPSIAISIGEKTSKGSGRSIPGFHLANFLRQHQDLFIDIGGHALACGFTIPSNQIDNLAHVLASAKIDKKLLQRQQRIDLEIPLSAINYELTNQLTKFEPFGLGNPTPIFQSTGQISDIKTVGRENKHLKFKVDSLDAIWFNAPNSLEPKTYNLAYSVEKDTWNGQAKLQLIIKNVQ